MRFRLALCAAALGVAACTAPARFDYAIPNQPESGSGYTPKPGWATSRFSVAAANPLATDAGYQVLKAGGSAVDAAIAVQMVLALVEPQSSGIGGGALLLHFDGKEVEAFDGRETAPAAADERMFLAADGKPLSFYEAVVGGRSVGVPGAVRMLEMAHRQYGKLPWATLFQPAITLAEQGFHIGPRLHMLAESDTYLRKDPVAAAYLYRPDGHARDAGDLLRNPELAEVLRKIAAQGSKGLLEGEVAQAIVDKVRSHPTNPGRLSLADLAGYEAKRREPICHDHRARGRDWRLCGFPPPSSGTIAIGQILGILENTPASGMPLETGFGGVAGTSAPAPSAPWLHLYTEASRLAFADRDRYVADPAFVQAPGGNWSTLLAPAYLAQRAKLIDTSPAGKSMRRAVAGTPAPGTTSLAPMPQQVEQGTSHISIVDSYGNAIAMTTTVEGQFGARQMVSVHGGAGGFLLNNELTDFSFTPADAQGLPIANRVQPGKRPRSSMSPTLVFDKASGRFEMSVGSPGGAFLIHFTAKTIYGVLDWGLDAQRAIDLPNFGSLNGPSVLEAGRFPPATVDALRARGAEVREETLTSGLQAIQRAERGWFGGADPRREGVVRGD
ncbi:gamma-glutamyltransferase family protein [Caenimonas aquaedulcis]|uniref:Gamma-glutamyltransferase family protein n=1 Tax=Caenimonas aquaedulcis TaxID=2793270 RepID=A0A931H2F9_9BURK|nr:gamma-glutamyltransferase family protein [Caenimonas aquaedulcis]